MHCPSHDATFYISEIALATALLGALHAVAASGGRVHLRDIRSEPAASGSHSTFKKIRSPAKDYVRSTPLVPI